MSFHKPTCTPPPLDSRVSLTVLSCTLTISFHAIAANSYTLVRHTLSFAQSAVDAGRATFRSSRFKRNRR
eukprot:2907777-Pleurochrysis_carterae.AAC.1